MNDGTRGDHESSEEKLAMKLRHLFTVPCLLVVSLLSGCFVSDAPAIVPQYAEDVGAELTYAMFDEDGARDPDANPQPDLLRIVRGAEREYQMQMVNPASPDEVLIVDDGVYVRRLGTRNDENVYVVQMNLDRMDVGVDFNSEEMGFKYLFYPVAINGAGEGVVAFMSCPLRDSGALARQYHVELVCAGGIAKNTPRVINKPGSEDLWRFLEAGLAADIFDWEDLRNESVMSWIQ